MKLATMLSILLAAVLPFAALQPLWAQKPSLRDPGSTNSAATASGSPSKSENADNSTDANVEYPNASKPGPPLIVIPGEIKSSDPVFNDKYTADNIADFAELELSRANFQVLERADLGPLLGEIRVAYTLGDTDAARAIMSKGKLKTTKWLVKFDILKVQHVAQQERGVSGGAASTIIGRLGIGSRAADAGSAAAESVEITSTTGLWVVGMRYKILDAATTEQVAQSYIEVKTTVGKKSSSAGGVSSAESSEFSLDALVQRLVQKCVLDIDTNHK